LVLKGKVGIKVCNVNFQQNGVRLEI
jgi:hypothetical protein